MTKEIQPYRGLAGKPHQGGKNQHRYVPEKERWPFLNVCKIPASSVPLGESIARNGKTLWGAFHGDILIAWADTAGEARSRYRHRVHDVLRGLGLRACDNGTARGDP